MFCWHLDWPFPKVEVLGHQKEVDSEGGVVAEAPPEAEEAEEGALVLEGKLWWNPTGTKVRT